MPIFYPNRFSTNLVDIQIIRLNQLPFDQLVLALFGFLIPLAWKSRKVYTNGAFPVSMG